MRVIFELEDFKKVLHATSGNTRDFVQNEHGWILEMILNYNGEVKQKKQMSRVEIKDGKGVIYHQSSPIQSIEIMRAIEKDMVDRFDDDPLVSGALKVFISEFKIRTNTDEIQRNS